MKTTAKQNASPTKARNTRSRSTSAIDPGVAPSVATVAGSDSGTRRNTSTANTSVVAASTRNSVT